MPLGSSLIYLYLSVGFGPTCHLPPKGAFTDMLSSDCHFHLMPLRSSYSFNSLTHNFWNTFDNTHSWNRLWQVVEPEPFFWKHFPLALLLGHRVILTRFQSAYEFVNYKSISIWRGKLQIRLYKAHYVIGKENCWYTL